MQDRSNHQLATLALALSAVQSAHMIEHVAQVIQEFVLHHERARGLLGTIFDFEWVHFAFNAGLEAGIVLLFLWCRGADSRRVPLVLTAGMWFQGYHVLEHGVKMYQYYALGITETPKGILGHVVPPVWLHFLFNLVVLLFIVGMWRATRSRAIRGTGWMGSAEAANPVET
jgi:hypothetical protein